MAELDVEKYLEMADLTSRSFALASDFHGAQRYSSKFLHIGHVNTVAWAAYRLADSLALRRGLTEELPWLAELAGRLHDLIEDTNATAKFLLDVKMPCVVVCCTVFLSQQKDQSREDYRKQVGMSCQQIIERVPEIDPRLATWMGSMSPRGKIEAARVIKALMIIGKNCDVEFNLNRGRLLVLSAQDMREHLHKFTVKQHQLIPNEPFVSITARGLVAYEERRERQRERGRLDCESFDATAQEIFPGWHGFQEIAAENRLDEPGSFSLESLKQDADSQSVPARAASGRFEPAMSAFIPDSTLGLVQAG